MASEFSLLQKWLPAHQTSWIPLQYQVIRRTKVLHNQWCFGILPYTHIIKFLLDHNPFRRHEKNLNDDTSLIFIYKNRQTKH